MIRKNKLNCFVLLIGSSLIIFGIYLISKNILNSYIGVIFGVGSGMAGVGILNILSNWWCKKNPKIEKLKNIELNDERNKFLHYKTGSEIYKINTYILSVIIVIVAILKSPFWIVLSLTGLLLTDFILYILIFNKNNKSI